MFWDGEHAPFVGWGPCPALWDGDNLYLLGCGASFALWGGEYALHFGMGSMPLFCGMGIILCILG